MKKKDLESGQNTGPPWSCLNRSDDTVTAANKQLPEKSLLSRDQDRPGSQPHRKRSELHTESTTAPELISKHHLQQEQRQFFLGFFFFTDTYPSF